MFSFGLLLLFLFGGKKKKVTKRKTAVCSFKAAARLHPAEAQELASLKQPALLFAVLRFSAFRLETEDGIFSLACSSLFALWAKSLCGEVGLLLALFCFLASLFALAFFWVKLLAEAWAFSSRCAKSSALYVEIKPVGRSALCSVGRGNELVTCVPWRE
ncbi:hypothetical protein [Phocaeicola fibrisolvens]|uniref:hypothetical protein n=1 Tax=Phocaeicola fibrisolvens TaxID=2981793 RepID=UPI000AD8BC5F|nr:hypothetical protein [Phocaeicola fibrisolvens]MCU6778614.1 hypothetical protein [Phocaeicola fibrisolvens]